MRPTSVRGASASAFVTTLLVVATVGCGGSDWGSVSPQYNPETAPYRTQWKAPDALLYAVRAFGANSVYAVGASGTILHSIDGERWVHQPSQTAQGLNAIFGTTDGKKLWIVGDAGTILHSTDGEHWTAQPTKVSSSLHSIFGAQDGNQLWAVGDAGWIVHSTDGEHWTAQRSKVPSSLRSIFGAQDGNQLWAVGDLGTILHSTDGEHWAAQSSGTKATLLSVFATPDGKQLWAVGHAGTILHSMDGEHWEAQSPDARSNLRSISGRPDGKQLWAVGERVARDGKLHGTILHSTNGKRWTVQYSEESDGALNSVCSTADRKQVWAVGTRVVPSSHNLASPPEYRSTILHSIDGEHWVAQSRGTEAILYSLFGTPDGKQLWAVGERVAKDGKRSGTIVHSTDGENWETQYSGTDTILFSIFGAPSGKQLWAVGGSGKTFGPDGSELWGGAQRGTILHSTDGEHWVGQSRGEAILYSVFGTPDGKQLWAVGVSAPVAEQMATAEERGTILYSDDGEHWDTLKLPVLPRTQFEPQPPVPPLMSIFGMPDGTQLWAAGGRGTILHSTDGQHWAVQHSEEPTPNNNLSTNFGTSLNFIFGTSDGKRLWAVGGEDVDSSDNFFGHPLERHCTILYSRDGNPWAAQSCSTNTPLVSIWGTPDGRQLWAVGEDGTILHSTDGEHWANHRTSFAFPAFPAQNAYENYTFQSIFGTADGKRLWITGSSPQQLPLPGPQPGPPTVGILLQGEPVHAPYVESARLINTLIGAKLELKLHVPTAFKGPGDANFQARNDFDFENNRPAPELAARIQRPTKGLPDVRSFDFDPAKAAIGRGQRAHFDITLDDGILKQHFDYTATYDPFRFFRDNASWLIPLAAAVLILGCFTLFLFTKPMWNLYLYRRLKLDKIADISIPLVGDLLKIVLRTFTILPLYAKHWRTLDAWAEHNRERLQDTWNNDVPQAPPNQARNSALSAAYVQLPVRVGEQASGALIQRPTWEDFNRLFEAKRWHVQIVGPGGAGKTTLARQIGRWALDGSARAGSGRHRMIPIWIDEDLSDTNPISKVIRDKLYASLPNEDLENDFCDALLRKQRMLVIMDRLSERSPETQTYMRNIYRTTRLGALIVTSRTASPVGSPVPTLLFPQPLNSTSLLFFMTSLLTTFAANKSESSSGEVGPLGTMTEQLQLGQRLATLIELQTPGGKQEIPLLPLQVRLFVEQAIDFLSMGKTLDDLPTSLPEVYAQYLKQVNPKTGAASNSLSDEEMLKVAKTLGKLALHPNYVPKEFSPEAAREALKSDGWTSFDPIDPVERLQSNGVLFQREIGAYTRYRFALDPIAEFLGAFAYAEECGANRDSWNQILESSAAAPGFQIALKLIRQA